MRYVNPQRRHGRRMYDCEDLVETLHGQARNHVQLAMIAAAEPVAEMHLDLAFFSEEQARVAEELCEDA